MRGISRIDSRNTHGWFVRVYRDGHIHSKMFSDGLHGGRQEALEASVRYHREYESKHPRSYISTRIRQRPQKNNTSGVVGVSDTYCWSRSGEKILCFGVTWRPRRNVTRCKKFYYHHYDSREAALAAAVEFRKAREAEITKSIET